jgi:hypothetical protein
VRTIHKYRLELTDDQTIFLPEGAEILSVQDQRGVLTLWASVDITMPPVARYITICGTGHPLPDYREHIQTVQQDDFVWHVFEVSVPLAAEVPA